jgi:hypothetical protein
MVKNLKKEGFERYFFCNILQWDIATSILRHFPKGRQWLKIAAEK